MWEALFTIFGIACTFVGAIELCSWIVKLICRPASGSAGLYVVCVDESCQNPEELLRYHLVCTQWRWRRQGDLVILLKDNCSEENALITKAFARENNLRLYEYQESSNTLMPCPLYGLRHITQE